MGLQQFFALLLRGWWIMALAVIVTTASTAFFVSRQTPEYRATTTVELVPQAVLDQRYVIDVYNLLDKRNISNTIARKAEGSAMAQLVADKIGVDLSVVDKADIAATVLPDSNLIEIQASNASPDLAAAICNAVAEEMLGQTPDKILQVEALDRATPPSSPIAPQGTRMLMLALFSGLVLGIVFILLNNTLRGTAGPTGGAGFGGGKREPVPPRSAAAPVASMIAPPTGEAAQAGQ